MTNKESVVERVLWKLFLLRPGCSHRDVAWEVEYSVGLACNITDVIFPGKAR